MAIYLKACMWETKDDTCYAEPTIAIWRQKGEHREVYLCDTHDKQMDARLRKHGQRSTYQRRSIAA